MKQIKVGKVAKTSEKKVEMVNPPSESREKEEGKKDTKSSKSGTGKVKIKTNKLIRLSDGREIGPGKEVMVSPRDAEEFCDKKFLGVYDWSGERRGDDGKSRHVTIRAERIA